LQDMPLTPGLVDEIVSPAIVADLDRFDRVQLESEVCRVTVTSGGTGERS